MYTKPTAPLSIGGVLDDGFKLTRVAYSRLFFISLVGAILTNVPMALMGSPADPLDVNLTEVYLSLGLTMPISLLVFAIAIARTHRICNGESSGLSEVMNLGLKRTIPVIVVTLLYMVAVFVGMILLLIPGIWLATALVFAPYLAVVDETSIGDSLRKSFSLVKGNWWRTTTVLVVLLFVLTVLFMVVGLVTGFIIGTSGDLSSLNVVNLIITPLLSALYMPFIYCGTLAILNDLRLRREGGDLESRLAGVEEN